MASAPRRSGTASKSAGGGTASKSAGGGTVACDRRGQLLQPVVSAPWNPVDTETPSRSDDC